MPWRGTTQENILQFTVCIAPLKDIARGDADFVIGDGRLFGGDRAACQGFVCPRMASSSKMR